MKIWRMTSLAQGLLSGVALSVLAAAQSTAQVPATTQPKLYSGSYHSKTNIRDPKNLADTSTITFTGTISEPESYRNWLELWALPTSDCTYVKAKFPRETPAARVKVIETMGYYELFYKLESKTAASDSVSGEIKARGCDEYNLNLIINTDLKISH